MESVDRKKKHKKGVKGDDDDHYTGGNDGNGDGRVLSLENHFQIVDNMEGKKKKRKKNKEKGSNKERDESAVSGHVGGSDGGDENLGEMEIGGHGVQNSEKGEVLEEQGESKKKKERSVKERDECISSGLGVEDRTDHGSTDGKDGGKGEGILEHGVVGLKAETKKRKKEKEKDANGWKDRKRGSGVQGSETHGEGLDVDVTEKIDKKKLKLEKGQNKKDLGEVRIPDAI